VATVEPLAARKSIDLTSKAPADLAISADPLRLKQILLNLLSNAVKFTPDSGEVTLAAKATNGSVRITVEDSGVGIPPGDLGKIFEEFHQVKQSAPSESRGTGIGLSLTKRFVELHGGTITVSSKVGNGSRFVVTLPR
jgi:signal transduction histidine kinase